MARLILADMLYRATIRLVDDSDPKIREAGSTTVAAIANASRYLLSIFISMLSVPGMWWVSHIASCALRKVKRAGLNFIASRAREAPVLSQTR